MLGYQSILTKPAHSYVEAKMIGSSSLATKFLITCLIVSVEMTVEIPSLLPRRDANVLFPVPEVPARRIRMFLFDSSVNRVVNIQFISLTN